MAVERRKDNKNRVLKEGEYERANGTLEYKWRDKRGKRPSVYAKTLEEAKLIAKATAEVTDNHLEGIKGAVATAGAVFLARTGATMDELKEYISKYYTIDFTIDEIRPVYEFNETCQDTVPQAMQAFFESTSFEDAIRNAISIGGDSDTLAAITGAVAEAYYGIPEEMKETALSYLDEKLLSIVERFEDKYLI